MNTLSNSVQYSTYFSEDDIKREKDFFDRYGYTRPFDLLNKQIVESVLQKIDKEESLMGKLLAKANLWLRGSKDLHRGLNRHLDMSELQVLIQDENLNFVLKNLASPSLILWRTAIFRKTMGSSQVRWHHDKHFQNGDQSSIDLDDISSHFSVVIALKDMTLTNGCFQVLPKSHQSLLGFQRDLTVMTEKTLDEHFIEELPSEWEQRVENITLKKGQFFLFHSALFHRSLPYVSGNYRVSFVMRVMRHDVRYVSNSYTRLKSDELIKL